MLLRGWAAIGVAALIVLTCSGALAQDQRQLPSTFDPPPVPNGQRLDVAIGLHIINLASIDEVKEQFEIDAYLFARWKDPRLAFAASSPGQTRRYTPDEIWIPKLEMVNAAAPRTRYDTAIFVSPDGTVNYEERCNASLSSKFLLRQFPFDRQTLIIHIHPFGSEVHEVSFSLNDHKLWMSSELESFSSLAQWDLGAVSPMIATFRYMDGTITPEIRFGINVRRRSSFYVWKVFLPLILMVFLSWAALWVEERDLQTQVTIVVTTILTVIAFAFAISATMPRVPYLTYIDAFFLLCYVFVFFSMVELMVVHVTHRSERQRDLGVRLRHVFRWLLPSAFAACNLAIALHFLS